MNIREVEELYKLKRANSIGKDYRGIVEAVHRNRLDFKIPNSDYSHALYLTELMFRGTSNNIRMINGIGGGCSWLEVLNESLVGAIERIKSAGGSLRAIFIGEDENESPPQSIVDLRKKFGNTVQYITAVAKNPFQHLIVCDDNMLRKEELHAPITLDMDADKISASVYLNNLPKAKISTEYFDGLWKYLKG